ncbi:MAG TPA: hypothetical protein VGW80_11115 [Solirubrobacterales bacterium]|jgi:hypothetical protein|nr:hypothetical protein [Solirubrobacterales bacterium]
MTRIALVVTYLITLVVGVIALDVYNGGLLPVVWLAASVLLGAGTGDFRFAPLSLPAIPIAIPFGLPADTNFDPVFPIWVAAVYLAALSSALILLAAFLRRVVASHRQRRRAPRGSGIA